MLADDRRIFTQEWKCQTTISIVAGYYCRLNAVKCMYTFLIRMFIICICTEVRASPQKNLLGLKESRVIEKFSWSMVTVPNLATPCMLKVALA